MKIRSNVTATPEECDALFNIVMTPCVTVYGSPEDQTKAFVDAKDVFATMLDAYLSEAFRMGKKYYKTKVEKTTSTTSTDVPIVY